MRDADLMSEGAGGPDPAHVVAAAKALCAHRSVSGEEAGIAAWTAGELERIGLQVDIREVLPGRPNVVGVLDTGRPGPTLLFNGHLDTLPIPAGYTHDPLHPFLRDGRLYGAEVNNMKGAVAAMIAAVSSLISVRDGLRGRIVLSAVMGECDSLGLGTLTLVEGGLEADFCINGEPTDLQVMTRHVGVTQLRIRARGISVHVCRREEGGSAIDELLPALAALDEAALSFVPHPDFPGLPTLNIGRIEGGTMASMLAQDAEALVDVRTVPGMTPESVLADIKTAIGRARTRKGGTPDVEVSLAERPRFCQQHPYSVDPRHPVVRAVADAHADLFGKPAYVGPLYPQVYFGTDASHLSRAGIPTVIYGPGKVAEINVADESVPLADLVAAARVYAMAGVQLCRTRS
jgi:acetylornithine deacetylase